MCDILIHSGKRDFLGELDFSCGQAVVNLRGTILFHDEINKCYLGLIFGKHDRIDAPRTI